jgi:predicted DNA-binding antitoxin AbrB/MazE fold protein
MTPTTIDAVYQDGVFRPLTPPDLPDGTRVEVRVVLTLPPPLTPEERYARIMAVAAKARPGPPENTSENVDAILYGRPGDPGYAR